MPTETTETTSRPKRPQKAVDCVTKPKSGAQARRRPKVVAPPLPAPQPVTHRSTKQESVLALLSSADGATLSDLMDATGWQQHSVRGFLAGTVKKKLGLTLTSSKEDGDLRRYRIVTRRGR